MSIRAFVFATAIMFLVCDACSERKHPLGGDATTKDHGLASEAWAVSGGGPYDDEILDLKVHKVSDTVFVAGYFGLSYNYYGGQATFGSTTLTSAGEDDAFAARLDRSGRFLWASSGGGVSFDEANGLGVGYLGQVSMTGRFYSSATFGSTTLSSKGKQDIFVAKLSSSGSHLWATSAGGPGYETAGKGELDSMDNLCFIGQFGGGQIANASATFGSTTLTSKGEFDIFVAKLSSSGSHLWATSAGSAYSEYGTCLTTDSSGNVYITGMFGIGSSSAGGATATFGSTTLLSKGEGDLFVAKLDSQGQFLWAISAGGQLNDYGADLTLDSAGSICVTGAFGMSLSSSVGGGSATFGSTTLVSKGETDLFVAKLDSQGQFQWAVSAGGVEDDIGNGVVVDQAGNILVCGLFCGVGSSGATFGTLTRASKGKSDVFVARLDAAGAFKAVVTGGGTGLDGSTDCALGNSGQLHVAGEFSGTAQFGSTTLVSKGDMDAFVWTLPVPLP